MVKKLFLFLPIIVFVAAITNYRQVGVEASENATTISLVSCEDAYVAGGENADKNFGAASPLIIRKHTSSPKNDSLGYIKFGIPSNTSSISKAILELTLQNTETTKDNNFTVYTTTNDWNEGTGKAAGASVDYNTNPTFLTYNNVPDIFPANQSPVDFTSTIGLLRGHKYQIDVTSLVNEYIKTYQDSTIANYISFAVSSTVDKGESTSFRSKNYTGDEPKLLLTLGEFDKKENSTELYEGLTYTTERVLNSSKTPVNMFTMEIDGDSSLSFYTGLPEDKTPLEVGKRANVAEMAKAAEDNGKIVLAGINGDFFNASNDAAIQPRGLVIRDGTHYHLEYNGAMFFGILKNGNPIIGGRDEWYANMHNLQMAVGGDIGYLVKDGVACQTNDEAGEHGQNVVNPRTAIGITATNDVIMTVCDGRTSESNGMVLTDLAQYMVNKGCEVAINLDGGWSSTMVKKNFETGEFDTCNYPSNNGALRPIGDAILVIDTASKAKATKAHVQSFIDDYMHMDDIALNEQGSGACKGDSGYYIIAKQALLSLESKYEGAIKLFISEAEFIDAYNRMCAWANANGEIFNEDGFINKSSITLLISDNYCIYSLMIISISTLMISLIVIGYKKKKKVDRI